jgi:ParB/RepB/Spo0J family partition protein
VEEAPQAQNQENERKRKVAKIRQMRSQPVASEKGAKASPPSGEIRDVSIEDIDQANAMFQCRLSMPLTDVRKSLERDGLAQPIDLVGPSPYRIIDGFRRCKAATELGWGSIRAVVYEMDDRQALRVAFTKNVVRKNLAPMEKANALWMAQKQGFKKPELLELFGLSQKQVDRYLQLLAFPQALQKCIDGKIITMAHAKVLHDFGVDSPADWKRRIEAEGLSAKQLRKFLRHEMGKKESGRKKLYLKKSKDCLRVYPFAVSIDTPTAEKTRIAKLLREVIEFLEGR